MKAETRLEMKSFMADIARLTKRAQEPFDPRIEALLEVIHSLVKEQVELDKQYAWEDRPVQDDTFCDDTDSPSADDLREMMGG
jgi:hypothetical protein